MPANYCSVNEHLILFQLFDTEVNLVFFYFMLRHVRYFGDTRPVVSEWAKTVPSYGVRCASAV